MPAGLALTLLLALAGPPDGALLMSRFECNRCHEGTGLAAAPVERDCVGCHRQVADGSFAAKPELLARWRRNIVGLRQAPSLAGIGGRLRRRWVRDFLLRPADVRPALAATMPRLPLSGADADALARQLVPDEASEPAPAGDVQRGRGLYDRLRCATCHAFTGADVAVLPRPAPVARGDGDRAPSDGVALAPDLALARARVQPARLADWIRDPGRTSPGSPMPAVPVSDAEAQDLAAFVLRAPLRAPAATPAPPPRLPLLGRRVRFAEVEARVLGRTCRHCHASADYALGDGGPGNSGGFGFPARGLDLSSYEGVSSGALDESGRRRSVFRPLADGTSALVARLRARQAEESGAVDPDLRGMPLGFPALTPADVQLVESWVAQGRPR